MNPHPLGVLTMKKGWDYLEDGVHHRKARLAYKHHDHMIYIFTINLSSIVNLFMFTNLAQILRSYQINQLSPSFASELSPCFPPCSMVKFHSSTSFSARRRTSPCRWEHDGISPHEWGSRGWKKICTGWKLLPICSMYGIFPHIWVIFRANAGKYCTHGAYRLGNYETL